MTILTKVNFAMNTTTKIAQLTKEFDTLTFVLGFGVLLGEFLSTSMLTITLWPSHCGFLIFRPFQVCAFHSSNSTFPRIGTDSIGFFLSVFPFLSSFSSYFSRSNCASFSCISSFSLFSGSC